MVPNFKRRATFAVNLVRYMWKEIKPIDIEEGETVRTLDTEEGKERVVFEKEKSQWRLK